MSPAQPRRTLRLTAAVAAAILTGSLADPAYAADRATQPNATQPKQPAPRITAVQRDGQQLRISSVGGTPARVPTVAVPATKQGSARFDLDGDGIDEIVTQGFCGASGYCVVIRYSRTGRMDSISPSITSLTAPNFGSVMTAGDFNGDGHLDLAVSNQGEAAKDGPFGGAVWIFFGGSTGLTGAVQHVNLDSPGMPFGSQAGGEFGSALAAGDINGDGYADLAVSAHYQNIDGMLAAGTVVVLYGAAAGLTTTGSQVLTEGTGGVPGRPRVNDEFGSGLAIGDVTGDGHPDLVIGAVYASSDPANIPVQGMVVVLPGSSAGVTATGSSTVYGGRDVPVITLGEQLVVTDIDGDGYADVLAPTPWDRDGALVYLPGTRNGIGPAGAQTITLASLGMTAGEQTQSTITGYFGFSLATGDVTGDGHPDVLVGAIGIDVKGVADAGEVYLIPGSPGGLNATATAPYWQGMAFPPGTRANPNQGDGSAPVANGYFGEAVAILNLDGTGRLDPLVGDSMESSNGGLLQKLAWFPGVTGRRAGVDPRGSLTAGPTLTGNALGFDIVGEVLLHG